MLGYKGIERKLHVVCMWMRIWMCAVMRMGKEISRYIRVSLEVSPMVEKLKVWLRRFMHVIFYSILLIENWRAWKWVVGTISTYTGREWPKYLYMWVNKVKQILLKRGWNLIWWTKNMNRKFVYKVSVENLENLFKINI